MTPRTITAKYASVWVCGPNLNDQTKGDFHVHTADCADLRQYGPYTLYGGADPDFIQVGSKLELVQIVMGDALDGSPEEELPAFWFAPCVVGLPLGVTPQGCVDVRNVFPSQARAAALLG